MQTIINLQGPFEYSLIPAFACIIIIIVLTIYLKNPKKTKNRIIKEEVKVIPEKNKKNIPVIKNKYLQQLNDIESQYSGQKIELRKAYQRISEVIRLFVFEITDITTQNYSLAEIKKLNMPKLYELIKEYYEPEFARKTMGDFSDSINKARRVIKEWK